MTSVAQLQQELDGLIKEKAPMQQIMDKSYDLAARRLSDAIDQEILDELLKEAKCRNNK